MSKALIRLLRHGHSVHREEDGAVRFYDILEEFKKKFVGALQWSICDWISTLAKGGGQKKRFQYCLNPNSSRQFLYFRGIQGHSGGNAVDPELHDNVLIPEDLTEYIYHVGNVSETFSTIGCGLIAGGRSPKSWRQSVFFTAVHPVDCVNSTEETPCDFTKPRITPDKNTWTPLQNNINWCNLNLAQERGLQFCQTRSHAIVLYNTLSAICIEKAVCMKTKVELYHKV